jgi:hypothetical protein
VTIDFLKTMISLLSRFFCSRAGMFLGAKNFQKSLGDLCVNCFITKTEFSMMCVMCVSFPPHLSRDSKKRTQNKTLVRR